MGFFDTLFSPEEDTSQDDAKAAQALAAFTKLATPGLAAQAKEGAPGALGLKRDGLLIDIDFDAQQSRLAFTSPLQVRGSFEVAPKGESNAQGVKVETGDNLFDSQFDVVAEHSEYARLCLRDPAAREALNELFDAGASAFSIDDDENLLSVEWEDFDPAAVKEPAFLEDLAGHLVKLIRALPAEPRSSW